MRRKWLSLFAAALSLAPAAVPQARAWTYTRFTAPSYSQTNYVAPASILLQGSAMEYSETYSGYTLITSVVLRANGVLLGEATLQPQDTETLWSFLWLAPPQPPARVTLAAVAAGQGGQVSTGKAAIAISAVNIPPVAMPTSGRTVTETSVFLFTSYRHPDAVQTCTFEVVTQPAGGTATVEFVEGEGYVSTGGGSQNENLLYGFRYRPGPGFRGVDTFSFRVNDGYDVSNVATATVTVVTNTPPVAYSVSAAVAAGAASELSIYPSYGDPDGHVQEFEPIVVTPPDHGTLGVATSAYGFAYFAYAVPTDYVGRVTFTYCVNDGLVDSNVATGTITIVRNTPPVAWPMRATTAPGRAVALTAGYTDAELQAGIPQRFSARVTAPPAHGTVNVSGMRLQYTPEEGFASGLDTFRFAVSDGTDESAEAECRVRVRPSNDRAGGLVLVVVHTGLYASLGREADRLVEDLAREGYTARLRLWPSSGTSVSNLWAYLRQEYNQPEQWLVGSVLVGNLPKARVTLSGKSYYSDQVYWSLREFRTDTTPGRRDIWVSRIISENATYGSEATLVRRALDANHAYRTGASRLPFRAFYFINPEWWNGYSGSVGALQNVWPELETRGAAGSGLRFAPERSELSGYAGADAFVRGGELLDETSHGNADGYMASGGWFTRADLYRVLAQQRVALITSCTSGAYGGIVNQTIFTRGGGCVLAVGGSDINYVGDFTLAGTSDAAFLAALAAGESWGEAMLTSYPFSGAERTLMYGDLSLSAMASAASNAMPRILSWSATETAGRRVQFRVEATDPDGAISNIEWFCEGYDAGRRAPSSAGAPGCDYVYPAPGTYTVRVEVMDRHQARDWREFSITVRGPPDRPMLVLSADNRIASLYLNGAGVATGANAADWTQADAHFTNAIRCVALKALNDQPRTNSAGLLAKILFPDGHTEVSTPAWKAYDGTAGEPPPDAQGRPWHAADYDDSAWAPAASGGAYGASPWGRRAGLALLDGAQWIWVGDLAHGVSPVYLRGRFADWMKLDSDGDGMSDADEFLAGTDRTNGESRLRLGFADGAPGGELSFGSVSGRAYTVWCRTSLTAGAWAVVPGYSNIWMPAAGAITLPATHAAPSLFYRLGVRR